MKTITVKIYTFDELSAPAKQRAKDDYAAHLNYAWADDALASLKALADHFNGKVKDYSIDWFNSSYSSAEFSMPEGWEPEEIQARLNELGSFNPETLRRHGDCVLTGYCADESAIDGFRAAWFAGERELDRLMQSAFKEWLKSAQEDCASHYTDVEFSDHCDANGYMFYDDGELAERELIDSAA